MSLPETAIYKLGYLTPFAVIGGDDLTMDQRRFETIERQLLWMFDIFGNGIIDDDPDNPSWHIQNVSGDARSHQVSITPGRGHIEWKSARTTSSVTLEIPAPPNLGTNQSFTYYIYAEATKTTPYRQTVRFFVSNVELNQPDRYVGLGGAVATLTSNGIVLTPHNEADYGRVEISLFSTIAAIVNRHRHIGGSRNPSPIDLRSHVQGKLSGDFIEDGDLSKFTKGTLDPERLPQIDHDTLKRRGTLTHSEIDSLLTALQTSDSDRLSDLFGVNLLQLAIAAKKRDGWSDIDEKTVNTIIYVPGVTPDSFVAYYENFATYGLSDVSPLYVPDRIALATIDKDNREIRGSLASPLASDAIAWLSRRDFDTALSLAESRTVSAEPESHDIVADGEGIAGGVTLDKPLRYSAVATDDLADWSTGYKFTDRITKLPATPPPTQVSDDYEVRRHVFLDFSTEVDWTDRTKIMVGYNLGTENEQGDIYMYLLLGAGGTNEAITLTGGTARTLAVSKFVKIHAADDPVGDGLFAVKNLREFVETGDLLKRVAGVGFVWDTETGWDVREMTFGLDVPDEEDIPSEAVVAERASLPDTTGTVFVWNDTYFAASGRLVFRFDSNYDLTQYDTVVWTTDIPAYVTVQTRVADTEGELEGSNRYTVVGGLVNPSGNVGRWVDIIVEMRSATDRLSAPFLDDLSIQFRSPGSSETKVWNSKLPAEGENIAAWSKAERFDNVICEPDSDTPPNSLRIADVTLVGQWRFLRGDVAYSDFETGGDPEEVVEDGAELYLAPMQVWRGSVQRGFSDPLDAYYLDSGMVVADTANDRIAHLDSDHEPVLIVQGNIRLHKTSRAFAALTAVYNPDEGKLWVAFSQNVTVAAREKMALVCDLDTINLGDTAVNVVLFAPDTAGKSPSLEVRFSEELVAQINAWSNPMKLVIGDGAVTNAGTSSGDEQDPGGGDSGGSTGGGSTGGGTGGSTGGGGGDGPGGLSDDCGLPDWLSGQLGFLYGPLEGPGYIVRDSCPLSGEDGLAVPDTSGDDGVFDPNETKLQGPGGQVGNVTLDVYRGPVVFDNLYSPQSIQHTLAGDYVVGTGGARSVISYGPTGARSWTISSTVVALPEGRLGSAYELDNGNVLVAAPPAGDGTKGKLMVISRTGGNIPVIDLTISGDPVRALPDEDGIHYWVAIYDRTGEGRTSRLMRMTGTGTSNFIWGIGTLVKPTGLRILPSGDILVSE